MPFEHDRGDPFVDLVRGESEQLGRDLRRGLDHWREYAGCSPGKHRRGHCHHHRHPELLARYRGQGRGRRGRDPNRVELAWKRSETAEHHARFAQFLILHMDRRSRSVGYFDAGGDFVPYQLDEIARELRRPGEDAIPLDVLEDVINAFDAAKLIYRWQGRDREVDDAGVVTYRGKTASLRVSHEFLIRSGMAQLRDQRLRRDDRRAQAAERRRATVEEIRAVVYDLGANTRQHQRAAEHIRRAVMADHPDWVASGHAGRFQLDAEIDRRLQEQARRAREAGDRQRPPPPDDRR